MAKLFELVEPKYITIAEIVLTFGRSGFKAVWDDS
jgi:hypothetical protein